MSALQTASVFILNRHRVLLLLRDDTPTLAGAGTWHLVGGFLNEGEHVEDAVRREAKEETGLVLGQLDVVGTHTYPNGRATTVFLTIISDEEAAGVRLGDEGQALRFFTHTELSSVPLSGSVRRYYEEHQKDLAIMIEEERVVSIGE